MGRNHTSRNILATNDASFNDGSGLGEGTVTPAKLLAGTGTDWVWQDWTPSLVNFTLGNGTLVAKYTQVGKTVIGQLTFTLGTTSAVGTGGTFTLPVTASSNYSTALAYVGTCLLHDTGANQYPGPARLESTTTIRPLVINAGATHANVGSVTATVPFTWASTDVVYIEFCYEAD